MGLKRRFDKLSVCARNATEKTGLIGACFLGARGFLGIAHVGKFWY